MSANAKTGPRAVTLAAGAVAAFMVLSSGTAAALAATGATSTAPTPAALAAATKACNQGMRSRVFTGKPVITAGLGSYTAEVYVAGRHARFCLYGTYALGYMDEAETDLPFFRRKPGPDQLTVVERPSTDSAPGFPGSRPGREGSEQHIFGLVGKDVSAVAFKFAGGGTVDATVRNGWYFAWWPADRPSPMGTLGIGSTSVRVTTGTGTMTSPIFGEGACHPGTRGCVWANQP